MKFKTLKECTEYHVKMSELFPGFISGLAIEHHPKELAALYDHPLVAVKEYDPEFEAEVNLRVDVYNEIAAENAKQAYYDN